MLTTLDILLKKIIEVSSMKILLKFIYVLVYTGIIKFGEWLVYLFVFSPMLLFKLEPFLYYTCVVTVIECMFWALDISKITYLQFLIGFWIGIFIGYFYIACTFMLLKTLISLGIDYRTFISPNVIDIGLLIIFYASIVGNGFKIAINSVIGVKKTINDYIKEEELDKLLSDDE